MNFLQKNKKGFSAGFTLMEGLVATAIFIVIITGVYQTYIKAVELITISRFKIVATALANEQFEIIRNLSYSDVGIVGGIPNGKIQRSQTLKRSGFSFSVITTIRNIDDPFDGTIDGDPKDYSPADYKFVALDIFCTSCKTSLPISFATRVAPLALEISSENGALFIQVFDANGQAIQGADVRVENNQKNPPIIIEDTTNNSGFLQIVDTPTGTEAYEITVTKNGYSQEKTYPTGGAENPNPQKPHATVATGQLTQISFSIDKLSSLEILSVTETCEAVPSIDFSLSGARIIGSEPNILKYNENHQTDSGGQKTISELEWDTYSLLLNDSDYFLSGVIPLTPLILNPNSLQNVKLIIAPKNPNSLLITIKDASSLLPLSGVSVTLNRGEYSQTLITGQGFLRQTDWSGGSGQSNFINLTKYFESDGNIEHGDPAGEIRLSKIFDDYQESGYLVSSSFDTGSESNFHQLFWQPLDQPAPTGENSVKFQIATNKDNFTWNFLGPDGSADTFYTLSDSNINSAHNNDRYLRYKTILSTASTTFTSMIADFQFTFTSACVPPGQVFFSGIDLGNYDIIATKTDYQILDGEISVSSVWGQYETTLSPE